MPLRDGPHENGPAAAHSLAASSAARPASSSSTPAIADASAVESPGGTSTPMPCSSWSSLKLPTSESTTARPNASAAKRTPELSIRR